MINNAQEESTSTFDVDDIVTALEAYWPIVGRIVLDLETGTSVGGIEVTLPPVERKPRQLKRLNQLKGLTIESTKISNGKVFIVTTCGAGLVLEDGAPKIDLSPDEYIKIGLLTKEDLAAVARAKKMGLM